MMFKQFLMLIGVSLMASNVSFAAQLGESEPAPIIEQILVNGADAAVSEVMQGLLIEVGKPLTSELLDASENWLWQHMRLRVLQIRQLPGSESKSVIVELTVEGLKSWKHIVFEGASELAPPDIELAVGLFGQAVDELELEKYERRISEYYFQEGFRGTEVSAIERQGYLAFVVTEGTQLTIAEVKFEGNTFFPEGGAWAILHIGIDLYEVLQQTDGVFSDDQYSADVVVEDVNSLTSLYREFGFLDVEISCRVVETEDASAAVLVYVIEQGPRYTIRSVSFSNNNGKELIFSEDELNATIDVKAGQFYDLAVIQKGVHDLSIKYGGAGRPSSGRVRSVGDKGDKYFWVGNTLGPGRPETLVDIEEPVVDVIFVIQEGEAFRLRDVVLRGYLGTEDRVVRRQIELEPGQEAREDLVIRSWRRINGLNFFKDENNNPAVNWHWEQIESHPELLDLVFEVKDKGLLNSFRFGGAWNSETGPALMVNLTKSNVDMWDMPESFGSVFADLQEGKAFHGAGQSFSVMAQPGRDFSSYALSFTEPDLLYDHVDRLGLNFTLRKNIRYLRSHEEERGSYGFTVSRLFGRDFSVFGGPSLGSVVINDLSAGAPSTLSDFSGRSSFSTLMIGARRNTIADQFSPVDGSSLSISLAQTGGFLGGDWSFLKSTVKGTKHLPLWEDVDSRRWILSLKGAVQKAWLQGDMQSLPYSESYFQGGNRTLRGFAYRGTNIDSNGFATPGKASWNASVEMGFPLYATRQRKQVSMLENLRGAAFVDFGATGADFNDMAAMRVSAGVAFKLRMPFMSQLPISLVLAKPLRSEEGDETSTFSFLLGSF